MYFILLLIDRFLPFFPHLLLTLVLLIHLWECEYYCLKEQQPSVRGHQSPALKVTAWFSSFDHNPRKTTTTTTTNIWMNEWQIITSGENQSPGQWCRCCQILLLLNAATFWASWGFALSLAPQQTSPWWSKNVVITNGQLLSVLGRGDGALDQHQPEQKQNKTKKKSPSLPVYCQPHSTRPETQTQDANDDNFDHRPDSVVTSPVHQDNEYHDTLSISPPVWQAVYDLSVHL